MVDRLRRRNAGKPVLAVMDGSAETERAVRQVWPGIDIQRCTNHKLLNLLSKVPALREEPAGG